MNAETPTAESTAPPAAKRRHRPEKQVEITDPKAIRALAHAARLEVISELYSTQVSRTATELAAQTGLTPSAMSYHLRALQKWGIVVPAATAGDARERRWKAAGTDFTIHSLGGVASPELAVLDLELEAYRRRVACVRQDPQRTARERRHRRRAVLGGAGQQPAVPDAGAAGRTDAAGLRPPAGLRTRGSGPRARGRRTHGHDVVDDSGRPRTGRRPAKPAAGKARTAPRAASGARRRSPPGPPGARLLLRPEAGLRGAVISGRMRGILQNMVN